MKTKKIVGFPAYKRCGGKLVLDRGKRSGRVYLEAHDFKPCPNSLYMENGSMCAHYNRLVAGWIMEWKETREVFCEVTP